MASFIDENSPFSGVNGRPLVNGFLYIGLDGADPKTNLITIFSDRELTIPLANPQTLDSFGRSTNKIWIPGRYSYSVENNLNVQKYIDLDAGVTAESGITALTNVQGTNAITAEASAAITEYVDKETYIFTFVNSPTGAITLNIDNLGAKAIIKYNAKPMQAGDVVAGQIWAVVYNSTNDNFELQSSTGLIVDFYEGGVVGSQDVTLIWEATDGNSVHISGSTSCTSFGTAPHAGARKRLIYNSAVILTHSANLALPGGVDYTTEAGDILDIFADSTTQMDVIIHRVNGKAVIPPSNATESVAGSIEISTQVETDAGTDDARAVTPLKLDNAVQTSKANISFKGTGTVSINAEYNVASLTDNAVGDYDITFTTVFADTNYIYAGSGEDINSDGDVIIGRPNAGTKTTSVINIKTLNSAGAETDYPEIVLVFFGNR